jgi:hypothetical protein
MLVLFEGVGEGLAKLIILVKENFEICSKNRLMIRSESSKASTTARQQSGIAGRF